MTAAAAGASRLTVTRPCRAAKLLDRQGRQLPVTPTLSDRNDGQRKVVLLDLNLAPLQEGDYIIELTGAMGQQTQRALLAFRIIG